MLLGAVVFYRIKEKQKFYMKNKYHNKFKKDTFYYIGRKKKYLKETLKESKLG